MFYMPRPCRGLVEAGQLQLQATTLGAQDGQLSINGGLGPFVCLAYLIV